MTTFWDSSFQDQMDTIRPEQIQPNSKPLANRFEGRKSNLISLKYIGGGLNGNYQGE